MASEPRGLSEADRRQLAEHGLDPADAERQLELLRHPPQAPRLVRPATVGDGIVQLSESRRDELAERCRATVRRGGARKLVPASGAATRMFSDLLGLFLDGQPPSSAELTRREAEGDAAAAALARLAAEGDRLPFAEALDRAGGGGHRPLTASEWLQAALGPDGLRLAELPKGLVPFHRYSDHVRTPFEEHLAEGTRYLDDHQGVCRFHFTVPADRRESFEAAASDHVRAWQERVGLRLEIDFSVQHPGSDTLAITPSGLPFRDADGRLLLRPGGHGALLRNLQRAACELVFLKTIDNVLPEDHHWEVGHWQEALGGLALTLADEAHAHSAHLHSQSDPMAMERAASFLADQFGYEPATLLAGDPGEARARLSRLLERPLRVCGMVANTGEPGGGPFWVHGRDGAVRCQIVEAAEVAASPDQQSQLAASTHFNPVLIAAAPLDRSGQPYRLADFVDPRAVFISRKSHGGRELLALERPGLWNGSMAGWNTRFVEVPGTLFAPVKTVFDLLRPEHQPGLS